MSVTNQLTRLSAGISQPQTVNNVTQVPLHQDQEIITGDPGLFLRLREKAPELPLQKSIGKTGFLLFPQLEAAVGYAPPPPPGLLSRWFGSLFHGALGSETPGALKH